MRAYREAAGLAVTALAEKAGISRQYVRELELDAKTVSFEVACKLADALGIDVNQLRPA